MSQVYVDGIEVEWDFAKGILREPRYRWLPRFLSRWYRNYWVEFTEEQLIVNRDVQRLIAFRRMSPSKNVIELKKAPVASGKPVVIMYEIDVSKWDGE